MAGGSMEERLKAREALVAACKPKKTKRKSAVTAAADRMRARLIEREMRK